MMVRIEFVKDGKTVTLQISEVEIANATDVSALISAKVKNALYMLERAK